MAREEPGMWVVFWVAVAVVFVAGCVGARWGGRHAQHDNNKAA